MGWTDPRTWVDGETVTAAIMNAHVRDNLNALGEWNTSWTPTWTGSTGNPVLGNGTLVGRYLETAEWVYFFIHLTMGGTTTYGTGTWRFDLPVNSAARPWTFEGIAIDSSASNDFHALFRRSAADEVSGRCDATTAGNAMRAITSANPFTWATGDELYIAGAYQKA